MPLSGCVGGINFVDPTDIRKAHKELMIQVRTTSIHKIQIEPIHFELSSFLPMFEKDFPEILNEMLTVIIVNNNHQIQMKIGSNTMEE